MISNRLISVIGRLIFMIGILCYGDGRMRESVVTVPIVDAINGRGVAGHAGIVGIGDIAHFHGAGMPVGPGDIDRAGMTGAGDDFTISRRGCTPVGDSVETMGFGGIEHVGIHGAEDLRGALQVCKSGWIE